MSKLPQTLSMPAPSANIAAPVALNFDSIDRAFQTAAKEIERYDQDRRKADDEAAAREVEQFHSRYQQGASERAASYDGRDPGFAAAELEHFDQTFSELLNREDLTDGVKMAVGRQVRMLRGTTGLRASTIEGDTRGRRATADRDAADQASAVRLMMEVSEEFDTKEDELRQGWDGISEGYPAQVMAAWRTAAQQRLEQASPAVRSRLEPMLLAQEASLQARTLAAEDERRDAQTMSTVKAGLTQFVNRAVRDPSLLAAANADAALAPVLEAAPAFMRAALRKETMAEARYKVAESRISEGHYEEVSAALERGAFDDLDPTAVQRLKDTVASARANGVVVSAMERADLEAAISADLRNILNGESPSADVLARARRAGGETLETQVRIDQQAAQNVRPLMARLRTMSPVEVDAELERIQAGATDGIGARTAQLAEAMVRQDRANRADPATWSMTPVGPGDQVAENVRDRVRAFQTDPSPETAQAYARATWAAQREAGIPLSSRRILEQSTADSWIAALDEERGGPRQAMALQALRARVELFGNDYKPQILRELSIAGLKDDDLGAIIHYAGSPRTMAQYTRDRERPLNDLVSKSEDRTRIDAQINTALAPYLRVFSTHGAGTTTFAASQRMAYSMVAGGASVDDAVRAAVEPMTRNWHFMGTWALPRNAGVSQERVTISMRRDVQSLIRSNGAEGYTPPSDRYSPDHARRIYAGLVEEKGFWRNLEDGSGVELVIPTDDGRLQRVKNKDGQDVVRTWQQLDRAARTFSPGNR